MTGDGGGDADVPAAGIGADAPEEDALAGCTALVTGASRGIGQAVAAALSRRGARLVITSRGGPGLFATARELGARPVAADLSDAEQVEELVEEARVRLGPAPDVVVNNAGVFTLAPARATDPDDFDRHLAVNLAAPFRLVRAFLPAMLERGSGSLVHVGSAAGREPLPGNVAYSASKYGLRGMHEVLSVELEGSGVRSLLVEPGPVDTEAWDGLEARLGRDLPARDEMLRPEAVARGVLRLLGGEEGTELALRPGEEREG